MVDFSVFLKDSIQIAYVSINKLMIVVIFQIVWSHAIQMIAGFGLFLKGKKVERDEIS